MADHPGDHVDAVLEGDGGAIHDVGRRYYRHRMGDLFLTVVDTDVALDNARRVADLVVDHLVDTGLILPVMTVCALGSPGHPPGPAAPSEAHDMPGTNGMTIDIGRRAYGMMPGLEAYCPSCDGVAPEEDVYRLMSQWEEDACDGYRTCPDCRQRTHLNDLYWGDALPLLGTLAFTFWNWPDIDLCDELARPTGHRMLQAMGKL